MTLLDCSMLTPNDGYESAGEPITEPPNGYRSGCVCAPSRATFWRYPMPGTEHDTIGMYLLLAALWLYIIGGYCLLAFGS